MEFLDSDIKNATSSSILRELHNAEVSVARESRELERLEAELRARETEKEQQSPIELVLERKALVSAAVKSRDEKVKKLKDSLHALRLKRAKNTSSTSS